jgi:mevalonate kinase
VTGVGFAPGKIILLGEHAVVFGEPALAAALPFGVTMNARRKDSGGVQLAGRDVPDDSRVTQAAAIVADAVGVAHAQVEVATDLPPGGGLGSSAAFAVALARTLAATEGHTLSFEALADIGARTERLFHGKPSGVDHTIVSRGGILRYWRGPPPRVETVMPARSIPIVIGLTGQMRATSHHVLSLAERVAASPAEYKPFIRRLGELALTGSQDVLSGAWEALGARMNEAHGLLSRCGVSSDSLDTIVSTAREAGALGAKLTGAGGGGAAIALAPDPERVADAIRQRGFEARVAILPGAA